MKVTIKTLNTLTSRIEFILEKYPETRNSDLELMARLCIEFYPKFDRPIYNWGDFVSIMRQLPTLDHVARARRKVIQNHNYTKYLPTSYEVAKARGVNEDQWRAYSRQNASKMNISNNIPEEYKRVEHEL